MLTTSRKNQFFTGFVEALLWSSTAPDLSEAPEGYDLKQTNDGRWLYVTPNGSEWQSPDGASERHAIDAAWQHSGERPPELEGLDGFNLDPVTRQRLREYCDAWCKTNSELLHQYARQLDGKISGSASVWEHAGHDFALTANGHGVGFWDRDLDELGDALTDAATRDYMRDWRAHQANGAYSIHVRPAEVMAHWKASGKTPPECLGTMFETYLDDDGAVCVEGFNS